VKLSAFFSGGSPLLRNVQLINGYKNELAKELLILQYVLAKFPEVQDF
jgi:hypothetical protein